MNRPLAIVFSALALTLSISAQQAKVLAPHRPIPKRINKKIDWSKRATQRSMIGGLWMTDANYKSAVYVRNVVESDPITVTPILWLANGTKYTLSNVTIDPAGTTIIDINAGLQSNGISPWATLNGYVELQYSWPWDPLCATIRSVDIAHSVIFTTSLRPSTRFGAQSPPQASSPAQQTVEGMWWKEEKDVTGFVTLANVTSRPVQATVQVSDNQTNVLAQHTVTISPHGMKMVNLTELPSIAGNEGGIRITYTSNPDALIIYGGLEDEAVGYSAIAPFGSRPVQQSELPPYVQLADFTSLAELGLMTGSADPMMNFPAGTTFKPYSAIRNVSDSSLSVTPTIWWMQDGTAHSAPLQQVQLQPYQTVSLDVQAMLALAGLQNFNGSFNIVFSGNLKRGGILAAAGSVDQTKTYVFEVAPRGVAESASKSLQYWSTANGDDTMITLWNPADEAQDLVFQLIFAGGHYLVPIHLDARATRTINVSQITESGVPDPEGNTIPPSVHEGGGKIMGSLADNQNILVAVDSGVYNVRKATCGETCYTCDGYSDWEAEASPFSIGVKGWDTISLSAAYDNGSRYDFAASWSSGNTSVMTVGSSTGTATGVSAGSTTIGGPVADLQSAPVYAPDVCVGGGGDPCPLGFGGGSTSDGTVAPPPQISSVTPTSFVLGNSGPITIEGSNLSNWGGDGVGITFTTDISGASCGTNQNNVAGIGASGSVVGGAVSGSYNVSASAQVGNFYVCVVFGGPDGGSSPSNTLPISIVAPTPVISGGNTVWWFNGQNPAPAAYPISVTLTSSAGASTSWSVSQVDGKVQLSSTTGAQVTITSLGTHFSSQIGDISITATANGSQSAPFPMTAKTPWKLTSVPPLQTVCYASPQTYGTKVTYDVIDNLSGTMSTDIYWNESLGTAVCENGSNWCNYQIDTGGADTDPLQDLLGPPNLNVTPAPSPTPTCSGQNSGTMRYRSIPQTIYVGNSDSGGVQVQTDTLGYYQDHGQHDPPINSPNQPPQ